METFILLTRVDVAALDSPAELEALEKKVKERVTQDCPKVNWLHSYAVLGPYDYLDVFEAPGIEDAARVSTIIRSFGHADTEIWGATGWQRYKELVRTLSSVDTGALGGD